MQCESSRRRTFPVGGRQPPRSQVSEKGFRATHRANACHSDMSTIEEGRRFESGQSVGKLAVAQLVERPRFSWSRSSADRAIGFYPMCADSISAEITNYS